MLERKIVEKYDTLEDLAKAAGIKPDALKAQVEKFNEVVKAKADPVWNRYINNDQVPPWKLCFMPLWNMSKARPVEDSVGLKRLVRFAAHIEEQTMCKARFVNAAQKLLQWEGCTR